MDEVVVSGGGVRVLRHRDKLGLYKRDELHSNQNGTTSVIAGQGGLCARGRGQPKRQEAIFRAPPPCPNLKLGRDLTARVLKARNQTLLSMTIKLVFVS